MDQLLKFLVQKSKGDKSKLSFKQTSLSIFNGPNIFGGSEILDQEKKALA